MKEEASAARSPRARAKRGAPQYHHGDLRAALVSGARAILESDGLEALSLRGVARAAGVSQAAPYHHFADKEALLAAVATEGFDALAEAMVKRMRGKPDPRQRLDASGAGYVAFAVANPALFRLMFRRDQRASADAALRVAAARAYKVLVDAVTAMAPASATTALICLRAWALVHGLATLILEAGVKPATYGAKNAEALAVLLFREGSSL